MKIYNEPTSDVNFLLQLDDNQQISHVSQLQKNSDQLSLPQQHFQMEQKSKENSLHHLQYLQHLQQLQYFQQFQQYQQKSKITEQLSTPQLHSLDSKKFGNYFTSLSCSIVTPIEIDKIRIGVKKLDTPTNNIYNNNINDLSQEKPKMNESSSKLSLHPKKKRVYSKVRECSNCKTTDTPLWRQTGEKKTVCNACGLYFRYNKQSRPTKLNELKKEKGIPTCTNCLTISTPIWRRDQGGNLLCNACGLYLKTHKVQRPLPDISDNKKT